MSAWGPGPFDNDLSVDMLRTIANVSLYPVLLEHIPPDLPKHERAYRHDRFRAALDLLVEWHHAKRLRTARGFFEVAQTRLIRILDDAEWTAMWNNPSGSHGRNYRQDCIAQLDRLHAAIETADA